MANIFNFPPNKRHKAQSGFSPDTSELVQFDVPQHATHMRDAIPTPAVPKNNRDWSNQELASIFHVKSLLDAAGVPNYIERNLSDEGDPWCVFCTVTGDVFIHLCRVDDIYILDSPNLSEPIKGTSFSNLIAQFSDGALLHGEKAAQMRRRLIKLELGGKIFLHPSVLLAALVWSIYLNSEDIILFLPEDDGAESYNIDQAFENVSHVTNYFDDEYSCNDYSDRHSKQISVFSKLHIEDMGSIGLSHKDVLTKSGLLLTPNSMAVGLSSVAIAYGFISESYFDDEVFLVGEHSAFSDHESGTSHPRDNGEGELRTEIGPKYFKNSDIYAQSSGDVEFSEAPVYQNLGMADGERSDEFLDIASLIKSSGNLIRFFIDEVKDESKQQVSHHLDVENNQVDGIQENELEDLHPSADSRSNQFSTDISQMQIAANYSSAKIFEKISSFDLFEYEIGSIRIQSSLNFSEFQFIRSAPSGDIVNIDLVKSDEKLVPQEQYSMLHWEVFFNRPENPNLIHADAISFINSMLEKHEDVQVISHSDEVILIDFSIFDTDISNRYEMQWELEHGGTIQAIGLKSDFYEFDLIA